MLESLDFLPRLFRFVSDENCLELVQPQDSSQRGALLQKAIERIWNAPERVGTDSNAPLQTAVDEVAKLLKVSHCSFLWYWPKTQQVQVVCDFGDRTPLPGECYPLEALGSVAKAIRFAIPAGIAQGEIIVNCGCEESSAWNGITRLLSRLPFSPLQKNYATAQEDKAAIEAIASLWVPVRQRKTSGATADNSRIGFIACFCEQPRHWFTAEIEWVQLIAQQLEIVLRQTQLYEQTQKLLQREQLVNQIACQTRQSFNLETILTQAIAQLLKALELDRCLVHLVEDCGNLTQHRQPQVVNFCETARRSIAYRRQHLYEVVREPFSPSIDDFDTHGPITQWVVDRRQAVVIPDITQDTRIGPDNEEYQKAQLKSSLVVPVQTKEKLHAILYLNQCSRIRAWSKSDRELAHAVATQLAISIQQAELYEQARIAALTAQTKATALEQASAQLQKVNQNLETEIAERKQAEAALQQRNGFLQLLQKIASAANEAATSEAALKICLAQICDYTGWPVGHVYVPDSTGELVPAKLWHLQHPERFQSFRQVTETTRFAPGMSLPGRVFLSKKPVWIADVNEDANFFRTQLAHDIGIKAGFAFPVLVGTEVVAVLEFFSPEVIEPNEPLMEVVANIGTQLGRVIERERASIALQESEAIAKQQAHQLAQTLQQLQQTQAQLILTEKMSSLGCLVGGVAHEINNPINFIYGNLTFTNKYTQELLKLVHLYQQYCPHPDSAVQEFADAIDLDFISEDLPKILSSMKVGADRIRQIVLSLRHFSHLDQAEMKQVDIHEGIERTLLILENRLRSQAGSRPAIEVIREYGDVPPIECYPGQLNQVFINIFNNAIDALESVGSSAPPFQPIIRIRTEMQTGDSQSDREASPQENPSGNRVTIRIADNGLGMSEAVKTRLFDPFFTTKPVGQGKGLGLSISYQIVVEKHRGSLWCESTPGQGAEFWIEIPVMVNG